MGPSPGLSRSVRPAVGVKKANAEPGRLILATVKRSCPCAPAYCNDSTVFLAISRSTATVQKVILGASKSLSMPRTRRLGNTVVPVTPSGPKLLGPVAPVLTSGIAVVGIIAPVVDKGVPATSVGTPKLAPNWKNGETA